MTTRMFLLNTSRSRPRLRAHRDRLSPPIDSPAAGAAGIVRAMSIAQEQAGRRARPGGEIAWLALVLSAMIALVAASATPARASERLTVEIGRASWRGRVCACV